MINKNSKVYQTMTDSVQKEISSSYAKRNSNVSFITTANSPKYRSNITFTSTTNLLISHVLIADSNDYSKIVKDLFFVTNLSAYDFSQLHFNVSPKQLSFLKETLLDLTIPINASSNWRTTVSFKQLSILLDSHHYYNVDRAIDTIYSKSNDIGKVVNYVTDKLGLKKAKVIIPKAYVTTSLANFWFTSFKSLKQYLDKRNLVGNDIKKEPFGNEAKDLKNFEK